MFIILFATHGPCGLIFNTYASRSFAILLYNSNALCSKTYTTSSPSLIVDYYSCFSWSHTCNVFMVPLSQQYQLCITPITWWHYCLVFMKVCPWNIKFGHVLNPIYIHCHSYEKWICCNFCWSRFLLSDCFPFLLPLEHVSPFMSPLQFYFINISDVTAYAFIFVSFVVFIGLKFSITCSCMSWFVTSALPSLLKFFNPGFRSYCDIMTWIL